MSQSANARILSFEKSTEEKSQLLQNGVLRLPEHNNLLREISLEKAQELRKEMEEAAKAVAKKLRLEVSFVMTDFSNKNKLQQDVTTKFSATSSIGLDRFAKNLIGNGRKHKYPSHLYGLEFIKSGVEYVITGLDTEGSKPFIRLKDAEGNRLACASQVMKYLKKQRLI